VEKPFDSSLKKVQPKEGETGAKVVENAQDNAQAVRVNQTYNENSSSLVVVPESPTVNLAELNPIDEGRLGPGRLNSRLKKKRGLGKIPLYLVLSIFISKLRHSTGSTTKRSQITVRHYAYATNRTL
jgi:hypothetical protein